MKNRTKIAAATGALLALVAITTISRPHASAEIRPVADVASKLGIGESLLLVVADIVEPGAAAQKLSVLNERFGHLQGFYTDPTDGYEVTGVLTQVTADITEIPCPPSLGLFKTVVGGTLVDIECPDGARTVKALTKIGLANVSKDAFPTLTLPACASDGLPPCQYDRIKALLGDGLSLPAGQTVVATGFRTKAGAESFLEIARSMGVEDLITVQVRKSAGGDVGLGQEPHPDGSGPLQVPLSDQEAFQR